MALTNSVPSLFVDEHDRFNAEMRDGVLHKLRRSVWVNDARGYRMLRPQHLRKLAEFESNQSPVISVYLELTPERRRKDAWHIVFKDLVAATLRPIADKRRRDGLASELQRIESALQAGLPALGRGVAFFSCSSEGLWWKMALSLALPDGIHMGSRPCIRPLARTRDEHDRFVLALLSLDLSRLFISQIGQIDEVFEVRADHATRKAEVVQNEARVLANVTELVVADFEGRHLLLSAAPELHAEFVRHLAKRIRGRLGAEFAVDIHAGPSAVAVAAEPAQRAIEEHEEIATVRRLLDASPKYVAWDVPATLEALQERRVMVLAVDDALRAPGAQCHSCNALLPSVLAQCPYCESTIIEAVEDVVELALEAALEQQAALEIVRSSRARQAMAERAPIGALFRW